MSKWINALKEWNKSNPKWLVPKKGTPEYEEVIKIMASLPAPVKKEGEVVEKKTYKKKVKKVVEQPIEEVKVEEVKQKKEKKTRKKKVVEEVVLQEE